MFESECFIFDQTLRSSKYQNMEPLQFEHISKNITIKSKLPG